MLSPFCVQRCSRSSCCLRNFATFGAITTRQYPWFGFFIDHLRHDRIVPDVLCLDLLDRLLGDRALLGRVREDDGAILCADVRALPIQCRRIVHAEEDLEQIVIADLLRIEGDLDDLGVSRRAGAHLFVRRIRARAARVAGDDARHAAQLAEQRVDAPKAAGTQRGDFGLCVWHA